jgi:FtsP/CotA-like multicopper oxidase with cupredoxin domain
VIRTRPAQREVWRVLNACAITYLNLQVVAADQAQGVEVIAMDGVPLSENGLGGPGAVWENHIGLPPGGRAEFIVKTPADGGVATLLTRSVNTGPAGENDPVRPLATIVSTTDVPAASVTFPVGTGQLPTPARKWLGKVTPVRTRKLYFSEKPSNPSDPNSPTLFYLTVDGQEPKLFDPSASVPNIVAHEGDVEDWIIENRTQELHAFHIHQVHFVLLEWFGIPVNEPFLRDTINVPFAETKGAPYPTVKLRMDFRDPNSVGTFIYHCHLLEHEDGGMMGIIRVEPRVQDGDLSRPAKSSASRKQMSSFLRARTKHILCGSANPLQRTVFNPAVISR